MKAGTATNKKTVYLDATVFSYLHDKRPSLRFQSVLTRKWWRRERSKFHVFTSRDAVEELAAGMYAHKMHALTTARQSRLLPFKERIAEVAAVYVREFVMPRKLTGDAMHLAYASEYGMDYLLTWNCNHLANANKAKHIEQVNARLGLHTPRIVTPMGLFEEEEA